MKIKKKSGVFASHSGSRAGVIGGQVAGNRVGLVALDQGIVCSKYSYYNG
jgi:hypothetical protein